MLRRNFFSFLLAPLAFFKRSEPLNDKNLEIDEDDMLIRFSGCNFIGNPPLPCKTWLEWSNSPTLYDVNIISNRGERPTLTKCQPEECSSILLLYPNHVCSKHGIVNTVSFCEHKTKYCPECIIECLNSLPIARTENDQKTIKLEVGRVPPYYVYPNPGKGWIPEETIKGDRIFIPFEKSSEI